MTGPRHALALGALLLLLPVALAYAAGVRSEPLFASVGPAEPGEQAEAARASVVRQRSVRPRLEGLDKAETLALNLFEDLTFVAKRRHLEFHAAGRFTWFGELQGLSPSHVVLAVRDGRMVGHVSWELGHYEVRPSTTGEHAILEIEPSNLPPDGEPVAVEPPAADFGDPLAPDSGDLIDVLIAYTSAAVDAMGDVDTFVQLLIDDTNQSYAQSGVTQRVNLVFHGQVDYVETGNSLVDLYRLRDPADGFMDEVHVWRDDYCADAVSLLAQNFDTCGLGFQMLVVSPGFASSAFNSTLPACAAGIYSYGHELGHNMGCNHDRLSTTNPGAFAYSHGYVNLPNAWRTIMAIFAGTQRLQYWSNPDILYQGEPMGVPATEPDSADCRKTLNDTRSTVGMFRDSSQCVLRVPQSTLLVDRAGAEVTVSWGAACGVAADYTIYEGALDPLVSSATYSHVSRICSDEFADLSETFVPSAANAYYLVVPRSAAGLEGAYGEGRPQGADSAECGIIGHRPGGVCP